ncbi:MAG: hypothetical protein ACM30I_17985 [Gemmatimonas sp.]
MIRAASMVARPIGSAASARTAAAYHEAGHAVMCRIVGLRLKSVSIGSGDWYAGQTTHRHPSGRAHRRSALRARIELERDVLVCLAGAIAQRKHSGSHGDDGGTIDSAAARRLAQDHFHSAPTAKAYVAFAGAWAHHLLDVPAVWAAVERVALALLHDGTLAGNRAEKLIGDPMADRF